MISKGLGSRNVIIVMAGGSSAAPIEHSVAPRFAPATGAHDAQWMVSLDRAPGTDQISLTPCPSRAYGKGETVSASQPAFPPLAAQATNLFQSVVAFVGDGCALVDDTEYRQRLQTCRACDRRNGKRCTACGCWIVLKARGRAFVCPLGRWH
jgi:hypothetical protein